VIAFAGETTSWSVRDRILEITLHRSPGNEIGSRTLEEWERLAEDLAGAIANDEIGAVLWSSSIPAGFGAGADLRELYETMQSLGSRERRTRIHDFLSRIHRVMTAFDECPVPTVAAIHGVAFGGGFELALTMDLLIADRTARFGLPELRLGLIPGFGGIPRLRRDLGNPRARDLLLTGRTMSAERAYEMGLVTQLAGEGRAPDVARATALQMTKFDRSAGAAAKVFLKPSTQAELEKEIETFTELFLRPVVEEALRSFTTRTDALTYLPPERT
jgi:enoyl-CoA hydratase/carnithine racemase